MFLAQVVAATAHVLDVDPGTLAADTTFEALAADSVARIAIADAVEVFNPDLKVSNDVLLFAATLGELAAGISRGTK